MILGIGTDIVEIERFKKIMERHPERFLKRLFSETEIDYCQKYNDSERHFCARFSAKEAVAKALGCGFGSDLAFKDIKIYNDEKGKPCVELSEKAQKHFKGVHIEISMSHCHLYATASALCIKK